jgi:ankyrin repeat protein
MSAAIVKAIDAGESINEVEAAGNTPLHLAAYEGWLEGVQLLLSLGAKVNASNNAGDRAWHWAQNMGHEEVMDFLVKVGIRLEPDDY